MRQNIRLAIWTCTWRLGIIATALGCAGTSLSAQARSAGTATEPSKAPVFKSDVREVTIVFRVIGQDNQPISGLTPSDIQIEDQGIVRKITSFKANVAQAQVVVLPDVSGSMSTVLEPLQGALSTFADMVAKDFDREPGDILLSLVPFGNTATVLIDRTSNPMEFKRAVMRLSPSGSTALVDSIMAALLNAFRPKEVSSPPKQAATPEQDESPIPSVYRRRRPSAGSPGAERSKFLVLFTDAGENASAHKWSDIASAMLGRDIVIYSLEFDSGSPDSDFSALSKVTQQSGGKVYRARTDNLEHLYVEIAHEIRSYYQLTFSAADIENPRTWRNVRVSTNRPGATIFARTGYCPETPCQKTDGSFVGGRPKTWNEVLAISRDPSVIFSVRQRLQELKLEYTAETERIVRNLPTAPLLIEKVWNSDGKRSSERDRPSLFTHRVENGNRLVGIDAEVCGITVDSETKSLSLPFITSDPFPASSNERVLTVLDPEIRIARRPGSAQEPSGAAEQAYFQSQAIFCLRDPSGRIPLRIRVQCNRPHFLIGDDLVQFAVQSLERGLKVRSLSASQGTRVQ
jgi:VWFA-related protein